MAGCVPLLLLELVLVLAICFGTTAVGKKETDYEPVSVDITFKGDKAIASKFRYAFEYCGIIGIEFGEV